MYTTQEKAAVLEAQQKREEHTKQLKRDLEERSKKQRIETSVDKVVYSQPGLK